MKNGVPLRVRFGFYGCIFGLSFSFIARVIHSLESNKNFFEVLFHHYPSLFGIIDLAPLVLGVFGCFLGIQQEKLKATFKKQKENQIHIFQSILKSLPYMVFLKDAQTLKFVHLNVAGEKLLSVKESDFLGKNDYDFFPKEQADFFTEKDRAVLSQKSVIEIPEEEIQTPSGKRILRTQKTAILNKKDEPIYLLGISEDITDKLEAQKIIEIEKAKTMQNSKLASMGELAAGIAHEITNPLSIVIGSATILREKNDELNIEKYSNQILKSSDRMMKIINSLRKFTRNTEVKNYKDNSLSDIINEALIIMATKAKICGVKIECDLHEEIIVLCDEIEIEQVVINLMSNAIDAARNTEGKWVKVASRYDFGTPLLSVEDSGGGIAADIQDKIFNPFYTTKKVGEGTGLGLSVSKGILDNHGATINVSSHSENTCFEIRFFSSAMNSNRYQKGV